VSGFSKEYVEAVSLQAFDKFWNAPRAQQLTIAYELISSLIGKDTFRAICQDAFLGGLVAGMRLARQQKEKGGGA
jgi:hypothetical protein